MGQRNIRIVQGRKDRNAPDFRHITYSLVVPLLPCQLPSDWQVMVLPSRGPAEVPSEVIRTNSSTKRRHFITIKKKSLSKLLTACRACCSGTAVIDISILHKERFEVSVSERVRCLADTRVARWKNVREVFLFSKAIELTFCAHRFIDYHISRCPMAVVATNLWKENWWCSKTDEALS